MPRQGSLKFLPHIATLASVILHAALFVVLFLMGTGGEIGIAGDGTGGMGGAIQVGLVSPPGAEPNGARTKPTREIPVEKTVEQVADARNAVPVRVEKRLKKEEQDTPKKPVAPSERSTAPAAPVAAGTPSPEMGESAENVGGAGGGSGHGGMGNNTAPGTIAGDGKPFGFSLAEVNSKPGIVKRVSVVYPREARQKRVTGHVLVRFHLDETGAVSHLFVKSADPPGVFNENTLAAVRQWRFSPAKMGGKAVPVWVELPIEFDLRR